MKRTSAAAKAAALRAVIAAERARIFGRAEPKRDDEGRIIEDINTCGTCGESWNDALSTSYTPAPSGRCPFEYVHPEIAALKRLESKYGAAAPLDHIKVGDMVAVSIPRRIQRAAERKVFIRTVSKVTAQCIYVDGLRYRKTGTPVQRGDGTISVPTAHELAEDQRLKVEQQRKQEEREAYQRRPDVRIASGLASKETDQWVTLGLDRLQQIDGWFAAQREPKTK